MIRVPKPDQPAGSILLALRAEMGWTQSTAASEFGVSLRAYQNYEKDVRRVPRAIVKKAVAYLNGQATPGHTPQTELTNA